MDTIKRLWNAWQRLSKRQKKWSGCGIGIVVLLCCGAAGALGQAVGIINSGPTPTHIIIWEAPGPTPGNAKDEIPTDTPVPTLAGMVREILVAPTTRPRPTATDVACCKQCGSDSKPCGDTCIPKDQNCNTPPGCACP